MTYGEKISYLRKSKGMTQEELGKVLNVTYQAVSKWERGGSLPDFETMSQIAKYFQVPLSYFEDGGEYLEETAADSTYNDMNNIIGMCTECGKMIKENEAFATSPKIICNACAERQKQEQIKDAERQKAIRKKSAEHAAKLQRGSGFDVKLIVSLILALAGYILFTILCYTDKSMDAFFYGTLLFFVPLALFAITHAVCDFINDLRDKEDEYDGYTRKLSFIIGAVFSLINFILFLVIYLTVDKSFYFIILMVLGIIVSFTFVSQYMWGNVIREMFTCGGFTFKLPGFIFSLSPDSIILMIVTKIFLGIIAIIIYLITTAFFAVVAILGSVITFIPAVIIKSSKDKKAANECKNIS